MNIWILWIDLTKQLYLTLKNVYSKLQLKHISEKDYKHAKKVWDDFEIKDLGEYHDSYVQGDTAQLTDVFQIFMFKRISIRPCIFCFNT